MHSSVYREGVHKWTGQVLTIVNKLIHKFIFCNDDQVKYNSANYILSA